MKKCLTFFSLLLMVILAACTSGNQEPTEEPAATASPALKTVPPKATDIGPITPVPYPPPREDAGYPAPALPEGYPAPELQATIDPYPGGFAVIQHPAGVQCEDPLYPDLDSAIAALEEAGIKTNKAEVIEMMVCTACGCPTSTHYRVLIAPIDLNEALSLGWQRGF